MPFRHVHHKIQAIAVCQGVPLESRAFVPSLHPDDDLPAHPGDRRPALLAGAEEDAADA
jgi:hypothetical protein